MPAHIGAASAPPHCLIHVFIILAAENRDLSGLEAVIVPEESLYKCDPQVRVTWGGDVLPEGPRTRGVGKP